VSTWSTLPPPHQRVIEAGEAEARWGRGGLVALEDEEEMRPSLDAHRALGLVRERQCPLVRIIRVVRHGAHPPRLAQLDRRGQPPWQTGYALPMPPRRVPRTRASALTLALALAAASPCVPAEAWAEPLDRAAVIAEAARLDREAERLYEADKLDEALAIAERELALTEKALGSSDPHTANARASVGGMWLAKGDYLAAEPLLREALSVLDASKDVPPREHAGALDNLAVLLASKGQSRLARPLLERALALLERADPPDPTMLGSTYGALGNVLVALEEPKAAMALFDKAITILEKSGSERHLILNLVRKADLMRRMARPRAVDLYERAHTLALDKLGPDSLVTADVERKLARYFWGAGSAFDSGERYYARAAATVEKILGPQHPDLADLLCDWAVSKQLQGDLDAALALRKRADAIDEHHLRLLLAAGSEEDKRAYSARLFHRAEDAIELTLTLGQKSDEARRFAFMMVLRRKGRVLDALTDQQETLRRHLRPEHQSLLAELSAARNELASVVLRGPKRVGPSYRAELAALEEREKKAEAAVSLASREYQKALAPPTLDDIARALPEGAVLVEMLRFSPTAIHSLVDARLPPVYVAFMLRHDGTVRQLRLTQASTVDTLARKLRFALASPDRRDVRTYAERLYLSTLARVEVELDQARSIILSPDGELNLIPFSALVDTKGQWLVQRYDMSYLSSGRDLLRLSAPSSPPGQGPVILANPAYGELPAKSGAPGTPSSRGLSLDDLGHVRFPPLPGTQAEADSIHRLLPEATLLTGEHATKAALRALHAPRVLHIATHGFSLGENTTDATRDSRGLELDSVPPSGSSAPPAPRPARDARFFSGLALAGANRHRAGDEAGVLTALEAASLDLAGTKLVVLSACETGVGDLARGEGVYNLRRAFVEAGAETQVMSLWQVDDDATRALMSGYYRRMFGEGRGRSAALREQQLALLAEPGHEHPYYWASFIVSGDPSPIVTKGASVPGVAPSARGCGCEVGSAKEGSSGLWLLPAAWALGRRKRRSGAR
jgi:CHAT domain-containing protein